MRVLYDGRYVMRVLCDGWYVVSFICWLVCCEVLCNCRYVVRVYMLGGMW